LKLSKLFYGTCREEIKKCVFEYAEKKKIKHFFSKNMQSAGNDWLWGFIKRIKPNFSISWRKPEKQVLTEFWHSTKMK
jgi:hypothetical protein